MKKKAKSKGRSGFWGGILLGGAVAAAGAYFIPPMLKESTGKGKPGGTETAAPRAKVIAETRLAPKPKPATSAPRPEGLPDTRGIPLFRRPDAAAALAAGAGLGESYPGSLRWKKADDLGWNAFASVNTPVRGAADNEAVPNSVTALFESSRADRVESILLVANVFNPRAEAATLEKFRDLALTFLKETACPVTRQFVEAVGVTSQEAETPDGFYRLKRISLTPASRWELSITSK